MDLKDIKTQKLGEMEKKIFFMAWLGKKLRGAGSRALPVLDRIPPQEGRRGGYCGYP